MWYLYLDESGDLGFDFVNKKPSKFFTVTIIRRQLEGRLSPNTPLDIYHWLSHENCGLQAVDLFCWGIFQKYERKNEGWLNVYKEKVLLDEQFL